jgi:flagellin-like protein|tara:strand:- start:4542 stop:5627 length:1086 start_codon:yes stop_codon:yes gene_type:complete
MMPKGVPSVNAQSSTVSHPSLRRDQRGVSEVLGVVMMLAMVITIMGGVWVFLNPYIGDFEDNTNWNSANGIAERFQDRIDVAGSAPEGTGIRHTLALQSTMIQPIEKVETWTIAADLTPYDSVIVRNVNISTIGVYSMNETARSMSIETESSIENYAFDSSHQEVLINHTSSRQHWISVTVYDADGIAIHRSVTYIVSGIQITTSLGMGEHQIALMNDARVERFPNEPWRVTQYPNLEIDTLVNGEFRLSLVLNDVLINGSLGSGNNIGMNMISLGPMTLFTGHAYNVKFTVDNALNDMITPQYHERMLDEYTLNRASGTLDTYVGYAPYLRASGADGFTVETQGAQLFLEVDVKRVEVSR